jgi:SNF2 family DNA or RNA helicase
MLDNALSFFTGVEVKNEGPKTIRILGMKTMDFISETTKLWKTSKITGNMFRKVKTRQIDLHPFFAPDMYYVCKRLLSERRTRINRKAVTEILHQLETHTWMKTAFEPTYKPRLNYKALDRFTVPMLAHQTQFLHTYDEMTTRWHLKGYILGAAPGSGKTLTGIALSECLDSDITICIVPKNSVVSVWADTMGWAFKEKPVFWHSLSGDELKKGYRYYIAHYEQLERLTEFFSGSGFAGKKINILLDESHNLNELKSERTQLFLKLCEITKATDVLWASGTPIKAMGSEVIPVLRTIDPYFDREAEERFRDIYGLSSSRALDILAHRLGYMTFKIDKKEIVGNKVEKFRVDVTLKNGEEYTLAKISDEMSKFVKERLAFYKSNMKMYLDWYQDGLRFYERTLKSSQDIREFDEYVRTARLLHTSYDPYVHKQEPIFCNAYEKKNILPALPKELKERFKDARSVYKYVNLKVQGEALGRILGKKRTQCNVDMLDAWKEYYVTDAQTGEKFETTLIDIIDNSVKKTVVFTSYVEVVDKAAEIFKEAGGFPLKVYGETNNELPQIVSTFERDVRCNPLVATLQSLSTAVPLIMANTVVFLNAPFREHEREQATSRVDRLGQTETVQVFDVFLNTGGEPNISTRSLDIMEWSRKQVEAMLGTAGTAALESLDDVNSEFVDLFGLEDLREDLKGADPAMESATLVEARRFSW